MNGAAMLIKVKVMEELLLFLSTQFFSFLPKSSQLRRRRWLLSLRKTIERVKMLSGLIKGASFSLSWLLFLKRLLLLFYPVSYLMYFAHFHALKARKSRAINPIWVWSKKCCICSICVC